MKDGKVMAETVPMIINVIMVKLDVISMLRFVFRHKVESVVLKDNLHSNWHK